MISNIVVDGPLSEQARKNAGLYAGCIAWAISKKAYLEIIEKAGFRNIRVDKETVYSIDSDWLESQLDAQSRNALKSGITRILSINVYAEK